MLRIEDAGRVRVLTLDRPEAKNAFNDDLYDAVAAALNGAATDGSVACVVLTGTDGAFTAGQDLGELNRPRSDDERRVSGFQPFMDALAAFDKPLVAAVNGVGVGIGLTLLAHCDLVLMAEGARLRAPFVSLGINLEAGSSVLLPALLGWQRTAHLIYTSSWIDAAQAVELGLAWRCVPADALLAEATAVAQEIAAMPVPSLVANKRLLLAGRAAAVQAARAREDESLGRMRGGPANREAIAAFRERRPPDFTNLPDE